MHGHHVVPVATAISADELDSPLARLKLEIQAAAQQPERGRSALSPLRDQPNAPSPSARSPAPSSAPLVIDSFRHSFASISSFDSTSSSDTARTLDSEPGRGRWSEHEDAFASMIERAADAEADVGERDRRNRWSAATTVQSVKTHRKRDSSTSTIRNRLPGSSPAFHIGEPHSAVDGRADDASIYSEESSAWDGVGDDVEVHPQNLPDRHSRPDLRRVSDSGFRSMHGDTGDSWEVDEEPSSSSAPSFSSVHSSAASDSRGQEGSSKKPGQRIGRIHHSRPAPPPPPMPADTTHISPDPPVTSRSTTKRNSIPSKSSRELYDLIIPVQTASSRTPSSARPHLDRSNFSAATLSSTSSTPQEDAEAFLLKGIKLHAEARREGDLAESTWQFRKAAEGGSLGGAVFYGLALRHGWGVAKDEKKGFQWLHKACDQIVREPSRMSVLQEQSQKLPRETVMALFEVGNCYLKGLGVKSDPPLALSYFRCAAEMGDVEAQEHLGFLLFEGKQGIKKDRHEAAKWYRAAVAQGASSVGLAWAYKDKYMHE